jgi:trk system potassium uptake protein TrkA
MVEVVIPSDNPLVGRRIASLKLPPNTLIVAIERDSQTVIPHGDTELLSGDRLMILVRDYAVIALHEYLASVENGASTDQSTDG